MEYSAFNDTKCRALSFFTVLLPVGLTTEVWIKSVTATSNITDVLVLNFTYNLPTLTTCNYFSPNEAP